MKTIYFVSLLAVILIVIFVLINNLFVKNKNVTKKIEATETKDFYCQSMSGFSFRYPVFKNWGAGQFVKDGQYGCKMFFDNPPEISYEIARQMGVYIIPRTGESKQSGEGDFTDMEKNKNGVNYKRVENSFGEFPSVYEFYGKGLDVRIGIIAGSEKDGFSEKIFWQTVVESFSFLN